MDDEMFGFRKPVRDEDWTDTMQVCLEGHVVNDSSRMMPAYSKNFCDDCGAKTITQCPKCGKDIPGRRHLRGVFSTSSMEAPRHCQSCGNQFPWKTPPPPAGGISWKPKNFQEVVRHAHSTSGTSLHYIRQLLRTAHQLDCPPPAWDKDGVYRLTIEGDELQVQRLGVSKKWEPAPVTPPSQQSGRTKSEKFGILDSPSLRDGDLASASGPRGVAYIYLDLDNFKRLNTDYTETIVDRDLLPQLQKLIDACIGGVGYAYAEGGDEITILLPNTSLRLACAFAEELRSSIENHEFSVSGKTERLTASIGLSHSAFSSGAAQLKQHANDAKAGAKNAGKNKVCVYTASGIRQLEMTWGDF